MADLRCQYSNQGFRSVPLAWSCSITPIAKIEYLVKAALPRAFTTTSPARHHCLPNVEPVRTRYSIPHSKVHQRSYHPIHIIRDASQESCRCGRSEEGRCPREPPVIQRFVHRPATHHSMVALRRRWVRIDREYALMPSSRYDQGSHPSSKSLPRRACLLCPVVNLASCDLQPPAPQQSPFEEKFQAS